MACAVLRTILRFPASTSSWRIPAVERSPKMAPVVSAIRGIATILDRVTFGTVALKTEEVKNSNKPFWGKAFLRVS
jgi:hypothetical protein